MKKHSDKAALARDVIAPLSTYKFNPYTPVDLLERMLGYVDDLIRKAVKTGSKAVFKEIMVLPTSINGDEEATLRREIMDMLRTRNDGAESYRARYLDGVRGVLSVEEALADKCVNDELMFKITNTLDWVNKGLISPHPYFRLHVRPTPTRKHGKLMQTVFASHHGVKMPQEMLVSIISLCAPLLMPRTRKTGPRRNQTQSFKIPRCKGKRAWDILTNEPELYKAKMLRNELSTAIRVAKMTKMLGTEGFLDIGISALHSLVADTAEVFSDLDNPDVAISLFDNLAGVDQLSDDHDVFVAEGGAYGIYGGAENRKQMECQMQYLVSIYTGYTRMKQMREKTRAVQLNLMRNEYYRLLYTLNISALTGHTRDRFVEVLADKLKPYNQNDQTAAE